ncbi:MAG: hypothetical protein AAGF11_42370 [Myxococcota bacterium]
MDSCHGKTRGSRTLPHAKDRASWEPGHLYGTLRWASPREGVGFECHLLPYDGATDPDYVDGE